MFLVVPKEAEEKLNVLAKVGGEEKISSMRKIDLYTPKKQEVKVEEVKEEVIPEEIKEVEPLEEVEEAKVEEVKNDAHMEVEPDAKLKPIENGDIITMAEKKICPVKILPMKSAAVKIDVTNKSEKATEDIHVDESLNKFTEELNNMGVKFSNIKRMPTGLVELDLIQTSGNTVKVTVDINSNIYNKRVFFIGKINPLDEYDKKRQGFVFKFDSMKSVIMDQPIDTKYYVPESFQILNRLLDTRTLKEKDPKKRELILEKASKVFQQCNDEITNAAKGEPYRFAFAKCKSEDNFTLVSSKKNFVSNLSNEKLLTTKEIWITVEDKQVTIDGKPAK